MRKITDIAIHCSATPEGKEFTVDDINGWHKKRGFARKYKGKVYNIGYHFVTYLDGLTYKGRPVEIPGAHVAGHNKHSIGICYIGGVAADGKTPKDTRTKAQKIGLAKIIRQLVLDHPTVTTIKGHCDYPNVRKACPSFDASEYEYLLHEDPREEKGHAWPQKKPSTKSGITAPQAVGGTAAGGIVVALVAFWDEVTAFFGGLF